jgi:hypothetical protein
MILLDGEHELHFLNVLFVRIRTLNRLSSDCVAADCSRYFGFVPGQIPDRLFVSSQSVYFGADRKRIVSAVLDAHLGTLRVCHVLHHVLGSAYGIGDHAHECFLSGIRLTLTLRKNGS